MIQDVDEPSDDGAPMATPFKDLLRFLDQAWIAFWTWADGVDRNTNALSPSHGNSVRSSKETND